MKLTFLSLFVAASVMAADKPVEVKRSVGTVRVVREFDQYTGKLVKEKTVREQRFTVAVDGQEVELPATANSRAALMVALRARFGSGNQYQLTDKTREGRNASR